MPFDIRMTARLEGSPGMLATLKLASVNASSRLVVLLCRAWKTWGMATIARPNTTILHSTADETVPFEDSMELLRNSVLPESALIEVGTEHRLADDESLEAMLWACERFA